MTPRRRWAWAGLGFVAILVSAWGIAVWRNSHLSGLPDVGDPFDVAKFRAVEVADADNAFTLYDRATAQLRGIPDLGEDGWPVLDWSQAGPAVRSWQVANHAPLDLWRLGTERSSAFKKGFFDLSPLQHLAIILACADFAQLAALEASRLQSDGDVEAAWGWYRAILRSACHLGRLDSPDPRTYAGDLVRLVTRPILAWADDPRVKAPLLRQALADLVGLEVLAGPDSELYKVGYYFQMRALDSDRQSSTNFIGPEVIAGYRLPSATNPVYASVKNEPERSRRILRLLFANWLAQADKPPAKRGRPIFTKHTDPILYETGPDDPPTARALPPEELARWYRSSVFAFFRYLGHGGKDLYRQVLDRERASRGRLMVAIALHLYQREHGTAPQSPRDLIGPYLESLPEEYEEAGDAEPKFLLELLRMRPH